MNYKLISRKKNYGYTTNDEPTTVCFEFRNRTDDHDSKYIMV